MSVEDIDEHFVCPRCGSHKFGSIGYGTSTLYSCHGRCYGNAKYAKEECFVVPKKETKNHETMTLSPDSTRNLDVLKWLKELNLDGSREYELSVRRIR